MAYGDIAGIKKDWTQNEIEAAKQAGQFFKSIATAQPYSGQPLKYGQATVTQNSIPSQPNMPAQPNNTQQYVAGSNMNNTQGVSTPTNTNAVVNTQNVDTPKVTTNQFDYKTELDKLKQQNIARITNKLSERYNQVVSDIAEKRAQVLPAYEQKRLGAQSQSQLQAKNFSEFLANRGLSRSGTSQQAELMRNMQLQGTMNQYDQQMQDELNYLKKQQDDAKRAYNSDLKNAELEAESNYMDNLIKYQSEQDKLQRDEAWKQKEYEAMMKRDELNAIQKKYEMDKAKRTDAEDAFVKSITGLGNNMDYQAEIDSIKIDGDPTNDWKIPYLVRERQNKINTNLAQDVQGIGQYYNDFQAEIDRRKKTPDKMDDALIPYLEAERAKKVASMRKDETTAKENKQKQAMDLFKQIGYATPEIASILGISAGTTTPEYLKAQYEIKKPYYKPDTEQNSSSNPTRTDIKNQNMADDISKIQSYPVKDAIKILEDNKQQLISSYGVSGYKQIWNTALSKAIEFGQANPYKD